MAVRARWPSGGAAFRRSMSTKQPGVDAAEEATADQTSQPVSWATTLRSVPSGEHAVLGLESCPQQVVHPDIVKWGPWRCPGVPGHLWMV